MSWLDTTKETIFKYSVESKNLDKAFSEWEYHGDVYDMEEASYTCELCAHPDLRYKFEIVNKQNKNILLIGSECIKKFSGIGVIVYGERLDTVSARKKVDADRRNLITDAKTKDLLNSLVKLSWKEEDFDIEAFIEYFKDRKAFTPKQLSTLFWRLEKHGISFKKSHFKITIRRDREKEQLLHMPDWQIRSIEESLSPSQRKWLDKNK